MVVSILPHETNTAIVILPSAENTIDRSLDLNRIWILKRSVLIRFGLDFEMKLVEWNWI